jgi:hypothetical protein
VIAGDFDIARSMQAEAYRIEEVLHGEERRHRFSLPSPPESPRLRHEPRSARAPY